MENLYSQWKNGRDLDLDPEILRKFRLREAISNVKVSSIKENFRDPNEILDWYFDRSCLFLVCDNKSSHSSKLVEWLVEWLLDQGADPNLLTKSVTINGTTTLCESPLYRALGKYSFPVCKLLIARGANLDLKMEDKTILLRYLYKWTRSHKEEFKFLIENGANIDISDDTGTTSRMLLERYGHGDLVQYYDDQQPLIKEPDCN